jgi:hypothetical protein
VLAGHVDLSSSYIHTLPLAVLRATENQVDTADVSTPLFVINCSATANHVALVCCCTRLHLNRMKAIASHCTVLQKNNSSDSINLNKLLQIKEKIQLVDWYNY